jgi:hypothetical protein
LIRRCRFERKAGALTFKYRGFENGLRTGFFDFLRKGAYLAKKKKKIADEKLYEILKKEPLTCAKIRAVTGAKGCGIMQIIDTLSLRYPVYQKRRGVYALLE